MILLTTNTLNVLVLFVILFILIIIFLCIALIINKIKYNNTIQQKNIDINSLKYAIKELDNLNKLLNSIIVKNNLSSENIDKNIKQKEFDLDDILIEISKNGINKLDPDKLEYLKKFKK